jgi:1,4-dihydroxy-2-naphthoyl-CoA hydrolase
MGLAAVSTNPTSVDDLSPSIDGFNKVLGTQFVEASGDKVVLSCEVQPVLLQPYGIVHGGVHCSLIETAASVGAALWFADRGNVVGVANHTNFIRAVREGTLTVTATPVQRGRTQQLWQVDVTDADDRLVARGEVRLANVEDAERLGRS